MTERAGRQCQIKISGSATSFTTEATTTADDTSYQITNAVKQVLDKDTAPTVYDDGLETAEAYSVNYLNGTITFEDADSERIITVSGNYLPMTVAAYAHVMSNSRMCDLMEATPFGSTNKKRIPGLKSASGTLSQFNVADTTYSDALTAGEPIVIEILSDTSDEPDRFWALLESDELTAALESVQDEIISWVSYDYWLRLGE